MTASGIRGTSVRICEPSRVLCLLTRMFVEGDVSALLASRYRTLAADSFGLS
jgi:hypothetical protein